MQSKINENKDQVKREEKLVLEVYEDFTTRQKARLPLERQWQLNMNFLTGNQYQKVTSHGEIADENKTFFWQNRGVFNHIAPIMETRLAKLREVSPVISVRPKSDDDKDVLDANLSEKLIEETFKVAGIDKTVKKVTAWSETCGTGFYKIVWNNSGGQELGKLDGQSVFEGEVEIIPVSPFEIFPDNLYVEDIKDCNSIIHARVMSTKDVFNKYGVLVEGEDVDVYDLTCLEGNSIAKKKDKSVIHDAVTVIERYEKPSKEMPDGRLITIAGGKLLYEGTLPYINGERGSKTFPFVKQNSIVNAGRFFGYSVIERLIPVQRAFNAVKNRKHEFLNRLSMGVMMVEDGSIDVDDLVEEGLSPGKVLVYRQGAKTPEIMSETNMPEDFTEEENKLINEFVIISGVSDVTSSSANASVSGSTALEILIEQDNSRMLPVAQEIRECYLEIARQTVRLYAQFMAGAKVIRRRDAFGKIKLFCVEKNALVSDDVYLENENELLYSNRQRKDMIFKLYDSGILTDEDGRLRPSVKAKVLSLLGYKDLDYAKGLYQLHEEKAQNENERMRREEVNVDEIDDHALHVDEHIRYALSEYNDMHEKTKERFYAHVKAHRQKLKENNGENNDGTTNQ